MNPKRKKLVTYGIIGFFFLFSGVEYAVILPTAWLYLSGTFDAQPYMLGLLLSAFCLSGMISGPIVGRISDKTGKTKLIILISNLFQIGGSIMYWLGFSAWFLVAGRFVAGAGTGMGAAIRADIARSTAMEERTRVFSNFQAIAQIGLLLGPAFNLFLRHFNFHIGPFIVDKYTSPGLFMAVLWILFEILVLFFYWDLMTIKEEIKEEYLRTQICDAYYKPHDSSSLFANDSASSGSIDELGNTNNNTDANSSVPSNNLRYDLPPSPTFNQQTSVTSLNRNFQNEWLHSSTEIIESAERFITTPDSRSNSSQMCNTHGVLNCDHKNCSPVANIERNSQTSHNAESEIPVETREEATPIKYSSQSWTSLYNEYMREEYVVLLAAIFMAIFVQISLETLLTPISKSLLDWGELENSYLYFACGIMMLISFAILSCCTKKFADRSLILFGFIMEIITIAYLLWFLPTATKYDIKHRTIYLFVVLPFNVFGLPFILTCCSSLFTKISRDELQGISQGFYRIAFGLGNLLAPIFSGSLFEQLDICFAVLLALNCLATVLIILSFKHLVPKNFNKHENDRIINHTNDENQPLLA